MASFSWRFAVFAGLICGLRSYLVADNTFKTWHKTSMWKEISTINPVIVRGFQKYHSYTTERKLKTIMNLHSKEHLIG